MFESHSYRVRSAGRTVHMLLELQVPWHVAFEIACDAHGVSMADALASWGAL